jgi:hypothetical protein
MRALKSTFGIFSGAMAALSIKTLAALNIGCGDVVQYR